MSDFVREFPGFSSQYFLFKQNILQILSIFCTGFVLDLVVLAGIDSIDSILRTV
jgi:hypothetical protein